MPVREIVVHSLGEMIDQVTPSEPDPITGRRRDSGIYRGAFDASHPLLTSLDRLGGIDPPHQKADLEAHILRNFIRYSRPHIAPVPVSDWELLITAQHHGVPTRLLDWSYSPLVAAFFATRPDRQERTQDRAVWRLDWQQVHQTLEFPPLALLIEDLHDLFGPDGVPFTPWRLFELHSERRPFACMLEPPSLNPRIVAQAAAFTLCSDKTQPLDRFLLQHDLGHTLTKFVIPAPEVERIRDQLDLAGVDERRLFPDLDGLASMIRRYYS
jgi:hypothetical protein